MLISNSISIMLSVAPGSLGTFLGTGAFSSHNDIVFMSGGELGLLAQCQKDSAQALYSMFNARRQSSTRPSPGEELK